MQQSKRRYLLFKIQVRTGHVTLDKYFYFHVTFMTGNNAKHMNLKLIQQIAIHHAYTYCDVDSRKYIYGEERVRMLELIITYQCIVIPRLTKIIRSGITFVSRNLRQPKRNFPQVSIENRLIHSRCCPLFKDKFYNIVKSTL